MASGFHHPIQVQSDRGDGRQLLEVQQSELQDGNVRRAVTNHPGNVGSRNVNLGDEQLLPCSGQLFAGKGQGGNDRDWNASPTPNYLKTESDKGWIGLEPGTTTQSYPREAVILGLGHGIQVTKPKIITDETSVVVYAGDKDDYTRLQSALRSFN